MNNFCGLGRLTKDPELRTTQNGTECCNFTLAINRRFKNASGEYEADFLNCVAWRHTASFIAKYFRKGRMIAIEGSVQTRSYENNDGKRVYVTEINVEQAGFAGDANKAASDSNNSQDYPIADEDGLNIPFDL